MRFWFILAPRLAGWDNPINAALSPDSAIVLTQFGPNQETVTKEEGDYEGNHSHCGNCGSSEQH